MQWICTCVVYLGTLLTRPVQTACNDQNLRENVNHDGEISISFRLLGLCQSTGIVSFMLVNDYTVVTLTLRDISIEYAAFTCTSVLNVTTNNFLPL